VNDAEPNADAAEIAKFDALASRVWDSSGAFGMLHRMNPVRLGYIAARHALSGARVLDVGCGGGILTEGLARAGATVTGIDLSSELLRTAELHALEGGLSIRYLKQSAEALADSEPGAFDLVTCLEMLEHVPDPQSVIAALARLVRPGGDLVLSTINRTPKAFLVGIVGAEYVTRLVPQGTHEYARFLKPSEIARAARHAGLEVRDVTGLEMDVLTRTFRLGPDVGMNYLVHLVRPTDA